MIFVSQVCLLLDESSLSRHMLCTVAVHLAALLRQAVPACRYCASNCASYSRELQTQTVAGVMCAQLSATCMLHCSREWVAVAPPTTRPRVCCGRRVLLLVAAQWM